MGKQPKLLITGATGYTGENACAHFSKKGYEVIAVTRGKPIKSDSIVTEFCDMTNKNEVHQLVHKIKPDYLLHLAGINHVGDSWNEPITTVEANLLSTLYIIDSTRQLNPTCRIIIVGSSLQTNPNNLAKLAHPYGLSKTLQVLISQAWTKLFNMDIIIAKPSNIIGPGSSKGVNAIFAEQIAQMEKGQLEKKLVVNNLNAERDFIDVRDVVRAYELLFSKGTTGEVYEISSGKDHSLGELIAIYRTLTVIDFEVESLATDIDQQVSNEKPTKLLALGWSPTFPITSSLLDTLNYFR